MSSTAPATSHHRPFDAHRAAARRTRLRDEIRLEVALRRLDPPR
ncbi:hypothetical protein F4692_001116 [Nocardioides cavernae]|uniref:Uncharacterized protein n=1 Tax=Nocardioides cavernae TaxID=1921566 RepID=A0A7Y9KS37_9ACTN|nr:hypothetical protein [Nocardioides cavernae]NYE36012.1 hypothetical protein [Nocardioides cavernae]